MIHAWHIEINSDRKTPWWPSTHANMIRIAFCKTVKRCFEPSGQAHVCEKVECTERWGWKHSNYHNLMCTSPNHPIQSWPSITSPMLNWPQKGSLNHKVCKTVHHNVCLKCLIRCEKGAKGSCNNPPNVEGLEKKWPGVPHPLGSGSIFVTHQKTAELSRIFKG